MKILTLNAHAWCEEDQINKIVYLADTIIKESIDVIALQESNQYFNKSKICCLNNYINCSNLQLNDSNYAYILVEELKKRGYHFYFTHNQCHTSYDSFDEGLAILSRYPIISAETILVSSIDVYTNYLTRFSLRAEIVYRGQTISVYSNHFGWWNHEIEPFHKQFLKLKEYLKTDKNQLIIICGDFNNPSDIQNEGYEFVLQNGFHDAYDSALIKDDGYSIFASIGGWEDNKRNLRIDYLFTNKIIKVHESKVIFNDLNYSKISDHNGVLTVLDL